MGNLVLYYARVVLAVIVLLISALYGTIASIICTLIRKQHLAQYTTARFYYNAMKYIMGIDVKVIGEEKLKKKPFIAVSNHQSTLDILMLGRMFPPGCTITAKTSLKYIPFLGWFMALSGTYFLNRSNRQQSVDTLNDGLRTIKEKKRALWIFPEGTRSYSTDLKILPFKKGAFHLAQQGKIPIVPIVVSNTSTLMNSKYHVFNRGVITVKVLDPISTENLQKDDIAKFSEDLRDKMFEELKEIGYSKAINETNVPPESVRYSEQQGIERLSSKSKDSAVSSATNLLCQTD
ncbi:similar to Saccharomyces cerevisiae YDL052C SLC1 1-acyl-sn-glycerol-3-phosphate acyltransferase [Maudiozyma barnettii]|uniref:1-acyl-sn-glycerol-3-phosphate acyltransferase n=1 Tax=Maudiozyma barnettii TaxID=61262 RepID=A0A8H2VC74_9SACH|nr:1-acylglycerol-3-phosphate O-acyltransferase SLC1 [Kazachstania barnettii]CAB4252600.1 similar to Saccharomyces cerevisiae YDL052C SLC1 1-acyl-sn-glycerol-3-phosphate acyltransferase [Kazachstania barnettii]CAD1779337.1 similar to Saccharomyces cerevisiae YDL052C SLC1 1-acyl-sn-glycerol-3-phosphate acyltransferase [Kazachstania barnettii]